MPKTHRGKTLYSLPSRGRGTCPVCGRTRTKLLWDSRTDDGQDIKICKRCKAHAANSAKA